MALNHNISKIFFFFFFFFFNDTATTEIYTLSLHDALPIFQDLNILFNEIAYNPPGAQDEGFLFWISWLNHNVNLVSTLQDGNGPLLRGIVMITCGNTRLAEQVASQRPFLRLLYDGTLTPLASEICPPSNLPFRGDAEADRDGDGEPDRPEDNGETTTTPEETTTTTPEPETDPAEPDASAEDSAGGDVAGGDDSGEADGEAGAAAGS